MFDTLDCRCDEPSLPPAWTTEMSDAFFKHIEAHQAEYIQRLAEAVAIDSVSGEAARRPKVSLHHAVLVVVADGH